MLNRALRVATRVALALAPATLLLAPAVSPAAHADGCPDIEVVFARGTTEPAGLGRVGESFVNDLRGRVGNRTVGAYAVNYPASWDFRAAAGGANDASGHIQYMMANCPDTRLVLGGYSQGAAVMDVISAVPIPAVGFDSPLPPTAPDHVAAIAVFGNPSAKAGLPLTVSGVWGNRAIDLCLPDDPICDTIGTDVPVHSSYVQNGQTALAADYVAGRV